jgi:DNA-binding CsgD family transcriptional regulator
VNPRTVPTSAPGLADLPDLIDQIRQAGVDVDLDEYVYAALRAGASGFMLTEREREVLEQVARGSSNNETAGALNISPSTTKTHVSRVLMKLDARDRAQLVVIAYDTGLATSR